MKLLQTYRCVQTRDISSMGESELWSIWGPRRSLGACVHHCQCVHQGRKRTPPGPLSPGWEITKVQLPGQPLMSPFIWELCKTPSRHLHSGSDRVPCVQQPGWGRTVLIQKCSSRPRCLHQAQNTTFARIFACFCPFAECADALCVRAASQCQSSTTQDGEIGFSSKKRTINLTFTLERLINKYVKEQGLGRMLVCIIDF